MPQDAFTLYHTAKHLNDTLCLSRVDKINQPSTDSIILAIRAGNKNKKLIISSNAQTARVCTTTKEYQNPLTAPNFCMLLRKHLTHSQIINITAITDERIIKIDFECKNELKESGIKTLYAEIMGKFSNIILVENGIILGAIKPSTLDVSNLRPIFSGLKYTLPIKQDKVSIFDKEQSLLRLSSSNVTDFSNFIFNSFFGVAKTTAEEIVYRYKEKFEQENEFIKNFKTEDFYNYFRDFYISPNISPNTINSLGFSDFFVTEYRSLDLDKTYFSTIDEAVDFFFTQKEQSKIFESKKNKLTSTAIAYEKKLKKKLQIVLEKELSCRDLQKIKTYGELIMTNLYQLKTATDKAIVMDYTKPDCPTIEIALDKTITPKENAEKFFKKYNKQKKTLTAIAPQKEELNKLLDYVSTIYREIDEAETISDFEDIEKEFILNGLIQVKPTKKQKEIESKPRSYVYQGFEILVGKNNLQNDRLTLSAERNDMFVHTKDYHSSHVIIKSNNRKIPDSVIEYACEICAYFSKARNSVKVPVDYTLKKHVKKPSGLKTGMVIYTNQKTILVTPNKH